MFTDGLANLLIPGLLILLLLFMFWSQRRRQQAISRMQSSLHVGDDICTTSGLFGRILSLDEVVATLEIAAGTTIRFDRRAIATKVDASGRPLNGGIPGPDVAGPGASDDTDTQTTPHVDGPEAPRTDSEK